MNIRVIADEGQRHNGRVDVCDESGCGWVSSHAAPTEYYLIQHGQETGHQNGTIYNDKAYDRIFVKGKHGNSQRYL